MANIASDSVKNSTKDPSKDHAKDPAKGYAKDFVKDHAKDHATKTVAVIGAGIVGVCTAIELQRKGYQVTLIDKGEPAGEASKGKKSAESKTKKPPSHCINTH